MGLFSELKKLTKPISEDEEYFEDEEENYERNAPVSSMSYTDYAGAPEEPAPRRNSILPTRRESYDRSDRESRGNSQQLQMTVVKPQEFSEAADIADQLRQYRSVLLNLEETPLDVARRLVDFLSGATYMMDGKIQRVSAKTFILTPASVDLMGSESTGSDNYF